MNKKGGDKIIAVFWFAVLLIVAGAVAWMVFVFYGKPYDIRVIESRVLEDQVANCFAEGGYLREGVLSLNSENFLEKCNFNFEAEEFLEWGDRAQYYVEASVYRFGLDLPENFVESPLLKLVAGSARWKPRPPLPEEDASEKDIVVIHYTAGGGSGEGVEKTLESKKLSVQYIVDRSGIIFECEIYEGWKLRDCVAKNASEVTGEWEKASAQQAGCKIASGWRPECTDLCLSDAGILKEECKAHVTKNPPERCCIRDFNPRSIGIEVANWGYLCGTKAKAICQDKGNGVAISNLQSETMVWEVFTQAQIDSLIELVAGIVQRNNILVDREHIIGHDQITNMKSDPGPAFPWEEFMEGVASKVAEQSSGEEVHLERLNSGTGQIFYAIDKSGGKYAIKILASVGKNEKNE